MQHAVVPYVLLAITVLTALGVLCVSAHAATQPYAIMVDGSTYVPMRSIFEWLGAQVQYDKGTILATMGARRLEFQTGSRRASLDGRTINMVGPPVVEDGTTYVPLRFVAETFGADVGYDPHAQTVTVSDGDRSMTVGIDVGDPVVLASRVLRQHMLTVPEVSDEWRFVGKHCVFLDLAEHPQVLQGSGDIQWFMVDREGASGDELDAEPRRLLEKSGWRPGDPWFWYQVTTQPSGQADVEFHSWNTGTTVHLQCSGRQWAPVRVSVWAEGLEQDLVWRVKRSGSRFVFDKVH